MHPKRGPLDESQQIDILLAEYGVLHRLLEWRLSAGDRRVVISAGLLTGLLTAVRTVDDATARLLLWALPVLLWVIFSALAGHTRSKEDLPSMIFPFGQIASTTPGTAGNRAPDPFRDGPKGPAEGRTGAG